MNRTHEATLSRTRTLQLDHIRYEDHIGRMTGRRTGGTYHYTELWALGTDSHGDSRRTNLYPHLRQLWGTLSAKRLTALTQTQPETLTLETYQLQSELEAWVDRAKAWHKAAGTSWKRPEPQLNAEQLLLRLGAIWPGPSKTEPSSSQRLPQQPAKRQRCAHCQLCGEKRPRAGMRGYGQDFKRICKRCWKTLEL